MAWRVSTLLLLAATAPAFAQSPLVDAARAGSRQAALGLLAEQAPQEAYVRHVSELEGLMALYGATGELRALTLWSARPLIPYLLLAELTGERAFLSLAFDERHSVGPLLMLPSERALRPRIRSTKSTGPNAEANSMPIPRIRNASAPTTNSSPNTPRAVSGRVAQRRNSGQTEIMVQAAVA